MATIFWDCQGVLQVNDLPPKTTMTGDYYCKLLLKLHDVIKQKRRGMLARGVWLLHTMLLLTGLRLHNKSFVTGLTQLRHLAYSPDLGPSDYFLFRHLKIFAWN